MKRLQAISLGIILGMTAGTICYTNLTFDDYAIPTDLEIETEPLETVSASFEEQVKADEEEVYQRYIESLEVPEVVKAYKAYDFIPLDEKTQMFAQEKCDEYGLDYFYLIALMESESSFDPDAEGDSGHSVGLMQINSAWWDLMKERGIDVFNSEGNIEAAIQILTEYRLKYDEVATIQMYKCGESKGNELLKCGIVLDKAQAVVDRAKELKEKADQ